MSKELTVYAIELAEGSRRIVACPTKSKAARLLGITAYLLDTHGSTSRSTEEVELALSDPGAVWAKYEEAEKWVKVSTSRKADALPSHGGARAGAGHPGVGTGPAKQRGLALDDANYALYKERGGVMFLRQVLASGLDLNAQEWADLEQLGGVAWLRQQMAAGMKKHRR
ncbi:hypothetical protein [Pseudomonas sp.]|uniref:hypothetical protein n=1 Tax=Pseudomonas sp. TaxID=306 RepID=UPI00290DE9B3|nr:hypothetical protein [Pseudomonas sp.]MDU4254506.1 hypothetical protein [Pseudomonas sp.]